MLSWLILRGRCRTCGEPISARYPLVELLTGALFVAVTLVGRRRPGSCRRTSTWRPSASRSPLIDLDTKRLPNAIVLPSYVVALVLFLLPAAIDGRWDDYLRAVLAGAALFAFYFLLAFIYPAGMGFGDVKLAGVLGIYLGWISWALVALGTFSAFLLGAVVGIAVIVGGQGRPQDQGALRAVHGDRHLPGPVLRPGGRRLVRRDDRSLTR